MSTQQPMLDAALFYGNSGWPVFPCGPDKAPRTKNGFKDATTSLTTIQSVWGGRPRSLIGVPTGQATGVVVLDIDMKNGHDGEASLFELEKKHGKLPDTVESLTKNGGRHLYYKAPDVPVGCSVSKLGDGLDVRADGGYVIAPPSPGYEWEASNPATFAEAPEWLVRLMLEDNKQKARTQQASTTTGGHITEGSRNVQLTSMAGSMRRQGIGRAAIEAALHEENKARCTPPLPEGEVKAIAASVARYAPAPDRSTEPRYTRNELESMIEEADKADLEQILTINGYIASTGLTGPEKGHLHRLIKKKTGIPIAELRQHLGEATGGEGNDEPTHHDMASQLVESDTQEDDQPPVGYAGDYYRFDGELWLPTSTTALGVRVAENFNDNKRCARKGDYTAIALHAYDMVEQPDFFIDAPVGIAVNSGFMVLNPDGTVTLEPLQAEHRQKVKFPFTLDYTLPPLWMAHLQRCFEGNDCERQIAHLQEIMGGILFRLIARKQVAVLLFGPAATGKSTTLNVISKLIPADFQCATSPFRWDKEYYVAALAGKYLNLVGELSDDEYIPSAPFKTVTGGDMLQGRHPTHRPFEFRNEAAHIFNSNHLIATRDRSEAFFRRWRIVEFANPLSKGERVDGFDELLTEKEMPQIFGWAIQGAQRLVRNGAFTETEAHNRLMERWRRETDPAMEFLLDDERVELDGISRVRKSDFYSAYTNWSREVSKKPLGRYKFYSAMGEQAVVAMGVSEAKLNNTHYFTGLRLR